MHPARERVASPSDSNRSLAPALLMFLFTFRVTRVSLDGPCSFSYAKCVISDFLSTTGPTCLIQWVDDLPWYKLDSLALMARPRRRSAGRTFIRS